MSVELTRTERLRELPSVDALVSEVTGSETAKLPDRSIISKLAQDAIATVRRQILDGASIQDVDTTVHSLLSTSLSEINSPRLIEVINATGVIIHTNLGRAPVSREASQAMSMAASRYTPLELEIESGKRGGRMSEISQMLHLLTGAEDSLVVNNNAAAVLLALSALCAGKEVVLSRSQAVEIGGGFRIPDVLAQSGARLVEVGTTNRTYPRDYAEATNDETAAYLSVHWSNFRIIGFTKQPLLSELSELAKSLSVSLIEDLGSGSLLETTPYGLAPEPTISNSIAAGVDIVCFSGDKLLGGPQAGIISGRRELVQKISRHPLARAVRADKTALAGVAATLRHYVRGEALESVPVWQMISAKPEALKRRAQSWFEKIGSPPQVQVVETHSAIGGGSLPEETLQSWGLAISVDDSESLDRLARRLRTGTPAVMPHIDERRLILDARTVLPDQDDGLITAISHLLS